MSKEISKTNLKLYDISLQYTEIKNLLEDLKKKLNDNMNSKVGVEGIMTDVDFSLTFIELQALFDAECSMMVDNVYYYQMVSILKSIGGNNLQYIVNTVMKKIMNNNLAVQFCFTGKSNKKFSYKNTMPTFFKAIISVVRYHIPQVTLKEVTDQIGKWLIQGKLRKTREDIKLQQLISNSNICILEDDLDTVDP